MINSDNTIKSTISTLTASTLGVGKVVPTQVRKRLP